MILDQFRQELTSALASWTKDQGLEALPSFALEEPPGEIPSDVACNLPLLLAKPLKKSPRAVAEAICQAIDGKLSMVDKPTVAGAGFINFQWKLPVLQEEIRTLLREAGHYGVDPATKGKKVLVEFVSANPTGPLHVGHGRGAALGDSLSLILSHLGYHVTREFYLNDAGNQVSMLGESILARVAESEGQTIPFPENGYHGDYVKGLAKEFLGQTIPEQRCLEKAVSYGVGRMTEQLKDDLAAFGVRFDSWFSEATLVKQGHVDKHVKALAARGHVKEEDDALWFVATGEEESKDKDRVLKKRDGRWTYFASDIAYHADKFERGYDRLIDIWGADHHGYVPRVKGSMEALGYDASKLHVILNQMVALTRNGAPVVMSKRAGEFVTLRDVVNEVGKDAARFFFAMRGPNSALEFDLELAKKHSNDNPVYYLQYAHARICSIFRQADLPDSGSARQQISLTADLTLLKEKEERDLMKRLALFPQVLRVCAQEDSPHPLANYLLHAARQFHHFYDHHRVLVDDAALKKARLTLLDAVRSILKHGLALLGVSAPESM